MQHKQIDSKMISSAGWEDGVLEVTFRNNNATYRFDAPEEQFINLTGAESPGKYFSSNIRGRFNSYKVVADASGSDDVDI